MSVRISFLTCSHLVPKFTCTLDPLLFRFLPLQIFVAKLPVFFCIFFFFCNEGYDRPLTVGLIRTITVGLGQTMSNSSSFSDGLDKYLEDRSYVEDFAPTSADLEILTKLEQLRIGGGGGGENFPHVTRWRNHLLSFQDAEKRNFPASKISAQEYMKRIAGDKAQEEGKGEVSETMDLKLLICSRFFPYFGFLVAYAYMRLYKLLSVGPLVTVHKLTESRFNLRRCPCPPRPV